MTPKLVLLRHGKSDWNKKNLFTGWADPDLAPEGLEEAKEAGNYLKSVVFDQIYSSPLLRAKHTAEIVLSCLEQKEHLLDEKGDFIMDIDPRIRERHYGDLVGLNKQETAEKFGKDQVKIWRRSYDIPPPNGESLADVVQRVQPFYDEKLMPSLEDGKTVLLAAHGNALRALLIVMGVHDKEGIMTVEVPTGKPFVFAYENGFRKVEDS